MLLCRGMGRYLLPLAKRCVSVSDCGCNPASSAEAMTPSEFLTNTSLRQALPIIMIALPPGFSTRATACFIMLNFDHLRSDPPCGCLSRREGRATPPWRSVPIYRLQHRSPHLALRSAPMLSARTGLATQVLNARTLPRKVYVPSYNLWHLGRVEDVRTRSDTVAFVCLLKSGHLLGVPLHFRSWEFCLF